LKYDIFVDIFVNIFIECFIKQAIIEKRLLAACVIKAHTARHIFVSINANRITGAEPKAAVRIIGMNTFVNRAGSNGRTVSVELLLKRTKRESHEGANERKEYPMNSRGVYFFNYIKI